MVLRSLIDKDEQGFVALCRSHLVSSMYAFGSSVHGPFQKQSDVDLVVDFNTKDPVVFGQMMLDLWDKLEVFFGRKVDLLTLRSVRNPIMRDQIEKTKVLIYDGSTQKVLV